MPAGERRSGALALVRLAHVTGLTAVAKVLDMVHREGGSLTVAEAIHRYILQCGAEAALHRDILDLCSGIEEVLQVHASTLREHVLDGRWRLPGHLSHTEKPFLVTSSSASVTCPEECAACHWTCTDASPSQSKVVDSVLAVLNSSACTRKWHVPPGGEYVLQCHLHSGAVTLAYRHNKGSSSVRDRLESLRPSSSEDTITLILSGAATVSDGITTCCWFQALYLWRACACSHTLHRTLCRREKSICGCGTPG